MDSSLHFVSFRMTRPTSPCHSEGVKRPKSRLVADIAARGAGSRILLKNY